MLGGRRPYRSPGYFMAALPISYFTQLAKKMKVRHREKTKKKERESPSLFFPARLKKKKKKDGLYTQSNWRVGADERRRGEKRKKKYKKKK